MQNAEELKVFGRTFQDRMMWCLASQFLKQPGTCPYDRSMVAGYALGILPPDAVQKVREHVENCWCCLDLFIATLATRSLQVVANGKEEKTLECTDGNPL